jgi:hypothetical protein
MMYHPLHTSILIMIYLAASRPLWHVVSSAP